MSSIKDSVEFIRLQRQMRHVQRLSGTPIIKPYSIAEHCYYAGLLFMEIAEHDEVYISPKDIKKVLLHDILEVKTGDLLYPAKHASLICEKNWDEIEREVALRTPISVLLSYLDDEGWSSAEAKNLFKVCDLLELYMFCIDELWLGNTSRAMAEVIKNCREWLPKMVKPYPLAENIFETVLG